MKRAIGFLLAALFLLLVIEPNLSYRIQTPVLKTPIYEETTPFRTNNDVEIPLSSSRALIYIDPARGGKDIGYRKIGQMAEKDLLMQLAVAIGTSLEKAGYQVAYGRWYDNVPACSDEESCESARQQEAKEMGADYILALSLNQDTSLHKGYSLFIQPNETLENLAQELANQIQAISYSNFEGIDTDHYTAFTVLRDLEIPSILLQAGYITNESDYTKLSDTKFQMRLATAVTRAFLNTIN